MLPCSRQESKLTQWASFSQTYKPHRLRLPKIGRVVGTRIWLWGWPVDEGLALEAGGTKDCGVLSV